MSRIKVENIRHPDGTGDNISLTDTGLVGIGTASPNTTLDVNGIIATNSAFYTYNATNDGLGIWYNPGAAGVNQLTARLGGSDRLTIDSSGRLLVGTSSSRTNFYTSGTNYAQVLNEGTDYSSATIASISNSTGYGSYLVLGRSRGTAIGSNTIVQTADTLGIIDFVGADGSRLIQGARISAACDGTPGANDMPGRLMFSTTADGASSPTERMRISQNGLVTIPSVYGNTTANAANVHVDSGGTLLRSTSSGKYKTNIETLEDSYADALLDCRPVWYRSTCESDNPNHGWWGFIAEEVAEIDPRLVQWKTTEITYDENGSAVETCCDPEPEGVAYDRFVPHLLNLIKRQKEQIEAMEARLSALEA